MGKTWRYSGVAAMTLLLGYAAAAIIAQGSSPWYLIVIFWAFIITGSIFALTSLIYLCRWCKKPVLGFPKLILRTYQWERYGPSYSLNLLSAQQPVPEHRDIYKAIISLHIKNRDNDSLKVYFGDVKFILKQQFGRKRLQVILTPPLGFPLEKEIAPNKESNYEIPLIGFCDNANYLDLNRSYRWEVQGINVQLSEVGRKELHN